MTATSSDAASLALGSAQSALQGGDATTAAAKCREAIALGRDDASTWTLLGTALRSLDPVAAEAALRRAIERDPDLVDAHFHLGNLHREQRRFADAIVAYETALAHVPGHTSILNNLGLALEGAGEVARAETSFREALRAQPKHRQALGNLAHLLCRERRYDEALGFCEAYLRIFRDADPTVWVDHGICVERHLRDFARAETSYRQAASLAPNDATVLVNLGSLLIGRGDFDEAADVLSRAVDADPDWLYASSLLAFARQHLCAWNGLDALHAAVADRIENNAPDDCLANPLATLAMPLPASSQQRVARCWARYSQSPQSVARTGRTSTRIPPSRLRLGYVSSDFRSHAIAFLLNEVWERHDRNRFETTGYSIGPRDESPTRKRIEKSFKRFVDAFDEPPARTAQRISDDGIDILIDLNGYTRGARSEIFAMRPAPVQISWLGYLGTLGSDWIDYIITDRIAAPEDMQPCFDERFLYLPNCYCPSDTRREIAPFAGSREGFGLPPTGFVFCCFNNTYKILPGVFDIWMRLVRTIPGSVLWLSPGSATAMANLRREASARDVEPKRLVFAEHVPAPLHLARHIHADLYLDTSPYNAGTTANEALLMGLPVLTCAGSTLASRVAASQLIAAGLPELVTRTLADYESLALELALDPPRLGEYRRRLSGGLRSAPLFDMARFTRDLEAVLVSVAG
jgi:protein O-GlcNAc transferase